MIRALNIALRTAHIACMGVLLGGQAFGVPFERLAPSLWMTLGTGLGLAAVESHGSLLWLHQGRGMMTLLKLALLGSMAFASDDRLPILIVVVVVASVGSHMPGRFRHYSVLRGEVVRGDSG